MQNRCKTIKLYGTATGAVYILLAALLAACAAPGPPPVHMSVELPILDQWRGDFPLSQLERLPDQQRAARAGYIGDAAHFAAVWQVFLPSKPLPEVDFSRHLVVFVRNLDFYNHTAIGKVMLDAGTVEIIAMETLSARPIEDKVAMALALVPRAGVTSVLAGSERIPVN
jgi:hypothetical protein